MTGMLNHITRDHNWSVDENDADGEEHQEDDTVHMDAPPSRPEPAVFIVGLASALLGACK